jgi:hypothetical protein
MLRAFFLLLPVIVDYQTVRGIAQVAFRLGVVNSTIFACIGVPLALRHRLTKRSFSGSSGAAAAGDE